MTTVTLVSVNVGPDTIVERRDETAYREYPQEHSTMVEFHQQLNRAAAANYATRTGATIMPVSNEGAVEDAVESLVRVIETAD